MIFCCADLLRDLLARVLARRLDQAAALLGDGDADIVACGMARLFVAVVHLGGMVLLFAVVVVFGLLVLLVVVYTCMHTYAFRIEYRLRDVCCYG